MTTDTKNDTVGVSERLINQVPPTLTSTREVELKSRIFQFQNNTNKAFGEIFEINDTINATKIAQSYITKNIEKTKEYIYIMIKNKEDKKEIEAMKKALKEIEETIVWEIKAKDGKLIKTKVGRYGKQKH